MYVIAGALGVLVVTAVILGVYLARRLAKERHVTTLARSEGQRDRVRATMAERTADRMLGTTEKAVNNSLAIHKVSQQMDWLVAAVNDEPVGPPPGRHARLSVVSDEEERHIA